MNTFYICTCTVVYLFSLRHDLFIFCFLPRFVGYIEFKGLELHASKLYGEPRTIHGKYCFYGCTCHMFHSYNFHLRRWLASEPSPCFAKFKERVHISCVLGPVQLTTGPNFQPDTAHMLEIGAQIQANPLQSNLDCKIFLFFFFQSRTLHT